MQYQRTYSASAMRKIVMFNHVTADGFFADAEGRIDWAVQDEALNKDAMASGGNFDTVLFGRRTYEMFESYWPGVAEKIAKSPNPEREMPESFIAMARFLDDANKTVFSTTMETPRWRNTRVIRAIDPAEVLALKEMPGHDMIMFGSGTVATRLTELKLIDEYQLVVNPVFLGAGRPLLKGLPSRIGLELVGSKSYPLGSVLLRYRPGKGTVGPGSVGPH